ncbi:hypothetical protein MIR68_008370 [Amoeboaphelidium protococcarum]|nr:hypothetical protein MIR68_008370 [Amoeboaphelidium protococcarum]
MLNAIIIKSVDELFRFQLPQILVGEDPSKTIPQRASNSREDEFDLSSWDNFDEWIQTLIADIKEKCIEQSIDYTYLFSGGLFNKVNSENKLQSKLSKIEEALNVLFGSMGFQCEIEPAQPQRVALDPDLVFSYKPLQSAKFDPRVVVEVKSFWLQAFMECDDLYSSLTRCYIGKGSPSDRGVFFGFQQLYGYMSVNNLRFGILTTYEKTWFVRRVSGSLDEVPKVEISQTVYRSQTESFTLLGALAGFYYHGIKGDDVFYAPPFTSPSRTVSVMLESFTKTAGYDFPHLKSSELEFGRVFGGGESASVLFVGERYLPSKIVCKIVNGGKVRRGYDLDELPFNYLKDEAIILEKLEDLQGNGITKVVGTFCMMGFIYGILMEYHGVKLNITDQGVLCHKESILQRLRDVRDKMHTLGVAHCDIRRSNICWDSDTCIVTLVDFSHARLKADVTEDCWLELVREDARAIEELFG